GRLAYLFPSIAYAHEANQFGVVWDDESDGYLRLWFARVSLDGVLLAAPEIISPPKAPPGEAALLPQIRWGGTEYGITWTDTVGSKSELHFQRRGSDGAQRGTVLAVTPGENASFSSLLRTG